MEDDRPEDTDDRDGRVDESPAEAIFEGATTGSMVGPVGLLGGIVLGWLISRVAKRRRR